jgi:hypothetical protein
MNIIIPFLFPLSLNLLFFVYMLLNSLALSFSSFPLLLFVSSSYFFFLSFFLFFFFSWIVFYSLYLFLYSYTFVSCKLRYSLLDSPKLASNIIEVYHPWLLGLTITKMVYKGLNFYFRRQNKHLLCPQNYERSKL